ncbi:MAG: leucine-rich repeat domain-containing protein, partial [Clostridia bacterium]|nr:leucine-rich repeat domain-containing protein [Clostridia bacterium]
MKKLNKLASIFTLLIVLLTALFFMVSCSSENGKYKFTLLENGTYSIKAKDMNNMPSKLVIPSTYKDKIVSEIEYEAFYGCNSITSIEIPSSITSIGDHAFAMCDSLTSILVNEENKNYTSLNGDLYDKEKTTLIQYAIGKQNSSFSVPNGVIEIGAHAFRDCNSLTSIVIPEGVTTIGNWAFSDCSALTSIVIPNSVTSIGNFAFAGCKSLSNVEIGGNVTTIGDSAFAWCESLTSLTIPANVITIGDDAFAHNNKLRSIQMGNGVTSIGCWAFNDCSSLTSVNYLGTIDNWAEITFENYNSNPIYYTKQLKINGEAVTKVSLTTATKISNYAFYNCSLFTSVEVGESVKLIGDSSFGGCNSLEEITIPFVGASKDIEETNTKFSYIFGSLPNSLKKVTVTGGKIDNNAFSGCAGLSSIEI